MNEASGRAPYGLRHDVGWAVRVWGVEPMLPVVTVLIEVALSASRLLRGGAVLAVPVGLALSGFVGTQRVWYLRAAQGHSLELREVPRLTYRFLGRYLVLALIGGIPISVTVFAMSLGLASQGVEFTFSGGVAVFLIIELVVIDAIGTFMTPALAFTTWRATEAISIGWSMLRSTWPRCAWYVAVPPLTAQAFFRARSASRSPGANLALVALTALVALACKGATAAFYLRARPATSEDGAAFAGPH